MTTSSKIRYLAVYCGSSMGRDTAYAEAAVALGEAMARRDIGLVYGGAAVGLMGVIANTLLNLGKPVIGVMPRNLADKEISHPELTDLLYVASMHERKAKMEDLADGFVALPGGFGTMDELFEIITWGQLGLHGKPCGLLNVAGYYDPLVRFMDHMVAEAFVKPAYRNMIMVNSDADVLLKGFEGYQAPASPKWVTRNSI